MSVDCTERHTFKKPSMPNFKCTCSSCLFFVCIQLISLNYYRTPQFLWHYVLLYHWYVLYHTLRRLEERGKLVCIFDMSCAIICRRLKVFLSCELGVMSEAYHVGLLEIKYAANRSPIIITFSYSHIVHQFTNYKCSCTLA